MSYVILLVNAPVDVRTIHCAKCVQIRSFFWPVFSRIRTEYEEIRKYGPEKNPYLDPSHAVIVCQITPSSKR